MEGERRRTRNISVNAPNIHLAPLAVCAGYSSSEYWQMPSSSLFLIAIGNTFSGEEKKVFCVPTRKLYRYTVNKTLLSTVV